MAYGSLDTHFPMMLKVDFSEFMTDKQLEAKKQIKELLNGLTIIEIQQVLYTVSLDLSLVKALNFQETTLSQYQSYREQQYKDADSKDLG